MLVTIVVVKVRVLIWDGRKSKVRSFFDRTTSITTVIDVFMGDFDISASDDNTIEVLLDSRITSHSSSIHVCHRFCFIGINTISQGNVPVVNDNSSNV